jgi:hypothetical protein
MQIETLDDVLNEIADKFMIYGACKEMNDGQEECNSETPFCCRVGFTMVYEEKIRNAIENEINLAKIGY